MGSVAANRGVYGYRAASTVLPSYTWFFQCQRGLHSSVKYFIINEIKPLYKR